MLRLLLVGLALVFPAVAVAECPPQLLHTTPAQVDDGGRVFVPLKIDGNTIQALVCTSCSWSTLGEAFVNRAGIKKRAARVRYVTADGSKVEYLAEPGETKLGDMTLAGDFLVDSGSGEDAAIGLNLLIYFDVEIDNGRKTVSFFRH